MKKKTCILALFFILFLSLVVWRHPIRLSAARLTFKYLSQKTFGKPIQFDRLAFEKGKVILCSPRLGANNVKDGLSLEAERATLAYDINWKKRALELHLSVVSPQIEIINTPQTLELIQNLIHMQSSWLQTKVFLRIDRGQLSLVDEDQVQKIGFNFEMKEISPTQQITHLTLVDGNSYVKGFIHKMQDHYDCKLDLENLKLPSCVQFSNFILSVLGKEPLPLFESKGIMQGSLDLLMIPGYLPMIQSRLDFQQIELKNTQQGLLAQIPKISLSLESLNRIHAHSHLAPEDHLKLLFQNSRGFVSLPMGSQIQYLSKNSEKWMAERLKGKVYFSHRGPTKFNLEGDLNLENQQANFFLEGQGFVLHPRGDVRITLHNEQKNKANLRLSLDPQSQGYYKLFSKVDHFSSLEVNWIKKILLPLYPNISNVDIQKGKINADMHFLIQEQHLKEWRVDHFELEHLSLGPLYALNSIENLNAQGSFHLDLSQENPLQTLVGKANFDSSVFEALGQRVKNIKGYSQFKAGRLEQSHIEALCEEMDTKFDWSTQKKKPLLVQIKGKANHFLNFIPKSLATRYTPILDQENLEVQIKGDLIEKEALLDAQFTFEDDTVICGGCRLSKPVSSSTLDTYSSHFLQHFVHSIPIAPTLTRLQRPPPKQLCIQEGWIQTKGISIEKYISPLIFYESQLACSGRTDLEGSFNNDTLSVEYSNYTLRFDHEDVTLSLVEKGEKKGKHTYHFGEETHFGEIPITEGSCLLKSSKLLFDSIKGDAFITSSHIFLPKLTTSTHQLELGGEFKMDFLGGGQFQFKVTNPFLKGKFSDFQSLIETFGSTMLGSLPLEGKLEIVPRLGFFELTRKEKYTYQMEMAGHIRQGKIYAHDHLKLKDLTTEFHYKSECGQLSLDHLTAQWQASPYHNYQVSSQYLKLHLNEIKPSPFDIRITNLYQDQAILAGQLILNTSLENPELKIIMESPRNHIGHIGINRAHLSFQKGLQHLHLDFTSPLDFFAQDGALLGSFLGHTELKFLDWVDQEFLSGEVSGQWIYNRGEDKHQFFAWGDRVKIGKNPLAPLQLKGHYSSHFIYLDDFEYLKYKSSCKIEEKHLSYHIHDLKLQDDQFLYFDLSGTYCKIFNSLKAHIHKFSCDLDQIKKEWPIPEGWKGKLDLKGEVEGGVYHQGWNYEVDLCGQTHDFILNPFHFAAQPIEAKFEIGSKGCTLHRFKGALKQAYGHSIPLNFEAHQIDFNSHLELSNIHQIDFSLPTASLSSVQKIIQQEYDYLLPDEFLTLRDQEIIEGSFSYNPNLRPYAFKLNLVDGEYLYKKRKLHLEEVMAKIGAQGVLLGGKVHYLGKPYWLKYKKESSTKDLFSFVLYERNPKMTLLEQNPHITLVGSSSSTSPLQFESVHGTLGGVKVDFVQRPEKKETQGQTFMGQIQIKNKEFVSRLPEELSRAFTKFGFGEGYFLSGQLSLDPLQPQLFSFEGLLGGRDFDLLGYEFKSLSSLVEIQLNQIKISELKLSDLSGEGSIPEIWIKKEEQGFHLSMPKLELKNFKPSLLHARGQGIMKHKPLIIEQFVLKNLSGYLHDTQSIKGSGSLKFLKSPKKQSSLLNIPGHILSKLGLDLTMLNPVEGRILYEIRDKKIELSRFLEVYSHDRRCHFQLAKSPQGSYIDFNGNVNVKIKMKQYVLLKLTEPFIISIQGGLLNPKYSFKRKKLKVDVPQNQAF